MVINFGDEVSIKGYISVKVFNFRGFLIRILAGDCSVVVNVDFYGKVLMKGDWLVNHNVLARDPMYGTQELEPLHSSSDVLRDIQGN